MIAARAPAGRRERPRAEPPQRLRLALTLAWVLIGCLLVDAAHLEARLWSFAWLGIVAIAWGLSQPVKARWLALSLLLGASLGHWLGYTWQFASLAAYVPGGEPTALRWLVPATLGWVLPLRLPLFLACLLGRAWRLPAWIWLPLGWLAGEAAWEALSGFSPDAWLYSQYQNPLVLKAVGNLGWHGALLACLAACAAAAECLHKRSWTAPALLGLLVAGLVALPTLPPGNLQALRDVGAVHLASYFHPPKAAPEGIRLLIWPEIGRGGVPRVAEGDGAGVRLAPPFASRDVFHLLGTRTRGAAGLQNAMLALAPDGNVVGMRAKSHLFPLTERSAVGLSLREPFVPGTAQPVLTVAGHRVTSLLCVEAFDRHLVAEGRRQGTELVALACNEYALRGSAIAERQMLAAAVFCAVEAHAPLVRSSFQGIAAMIGADGRILAQAPPGTDGVLTLEGDRPPVVHQPIAVLYSQKTPTMRAALPASSYTAYPLEGFKPGGTRAQVVILAGHSAPPTYLDRPAGEVAAAIASFKPELVVLDTCFGASTPLLDALARQGLHAWVVAPPFRIPDTGLVYAKGFLQAAPARERALRVRTDPPFPLLRWQLDGDELSRVEAAARGLDARTLRRRLKSVQPPLVRMQISGALEPGVPVLVPVAPAMFHSSPPRKALTKQADGS